MVEQYMQVKLHYKWLNAQVIEPQGNNFIIAAKQNGTIYEYVVHRNRLRPITDETVRSTLGLQPLTEAYAHLNPDLIASASSAQSVVNQSAVK